MQIDTSRDRSRIVAVLGPTNTGKTHLAMERMLGHASGMIGFPLRLLARENYDRAVRVKGRRHVALITGEEKIVPAHARYFLCTVESMPVDRRVAFLGVDEIQMCADPDRGHVFTDALLSARGEDETMFMGAETIRPLLRRLVPEAEFLSRPRFSTLTYSGQRKITRLPPRSAAVAFSAADVYAIAEVVRRQRGGTAVVLGALSPRTRNAQVAMYQAGDVDYLVATDAIGMGLNMDIDHVAFAATRKFDGQRVRELTPAELAQIAGRAGRHMNAGTFGTTADVGPLDQETVDAIENHRFPPLAALFWRNAHLRFTSLDALRRSLAVPPEMPGLVRAREADDEAALAALSADADIARLATGADAVRLLWEVCRIPDFGNLMSDAHTRLMGRIYRHLMGPAGRLPTDWVADQVVRIERTDGDIETLVQRIANVRTWTYVSYRGDWLADAGHWQERTRAVEDRLSDALHERLTQRFVDRRSAILVSRLMESQTLTAAVDGDGEVLVEGHFVGRLDGFRFAADGSGAGAGAAVKRVRGAAMRALGAEIAARVGRLEADGDEAFALADGRRLLWRGAHVARLVAGKDVLSPGVEAMASDLLEPDMRERVRRRLAAWLAGTIEACLAPLFEARRASLNGAARGLVFQLCEALGSLPRRRAASQVEALGRDGRKALRKLGVRLGRESVFMPALIKPRAVEMRGLLWAVNEGLGDSAVPAPGRVSVPLDKGVPHRFYEAVGYRPLGPRALRVDIVERLAERAWKLSRAGPFAAGPELLSLAGCASEEMSGVLAALGYRAKDTDGGVRYAPAPVRRRKGDQRRAREAAGRAAESPFSRLRDPAPRS
ncbi:MAG: helicase-related protein [Alphaproteobacteria bacterium]|nr:helicase-related protein [Alphaproteobacteria bacterium]